MSVTLHRPGRAPSFPHRLPTRVPAFVQDLRRHGRRTALLTATECLTYDDLADRVEDLATRIGAGRRLVLIETSNDVASVTGYLAALHAGHVALLADRADPAQLATLIRTFDPDVVLGADGSPRDRHVGSRHVLHPDLALLLATSGSSGSPRLVRLSSLAVEANAAAIASYLQITADDRAALTLPMHYCYGLSILDSNLLAGASLLLSTRSMLNPRFWEAVREQRVTSLHGVPYSFTLLDAVGFDDMDLPHLRYVTQAGGRLAPEQVRRWTEAGRRHGWELVVMYGQTEATARMAYLPPHLAAEHPDAVGVPIPGGRLTVAPVPGGDKISLLDRSEPPGDVGELVFHGPSVMLGYASTSADLGLGRTVTELRTGDLGCRGADGLFRVVGRLSRFVKPFGVAIDLDVLEQQLAGHGVDAACTGTDEQVVVAVPRDTTGDVGARVQALLQLHLGLPDPTSRVVVVDDLPRRPNGKIDHPALDRLLAPAPASTPHRLAPFPEPGPDSLIPSPRSPAEASSGTRRWARVRRGRRRDT